MPDTPPVDSPPAPASEIAPEVPPVAPADVPPAPKAPPDQMTHPWIGRSFGFEYQGKWLEGSAYRKDRGLDASGWYGTLFYENLEELLNRAAFTPAQRTEVIETIQRLGA